MVMETETMMATFVAESAGFVVTRERFCGRSEAQQDG
jgi:hypothetical protein